MKSNKKGFTLVEVLLVIVLIAIIAIITLPNIMKALQSSKSEGGKALEQLLEKNLELYNETNKEDLWANQNVSNVCINVSWEELQSVNEDISFGECKLYETSTIKPLVIKKLGKNKYEYYANIVCAKSFQTDEISVDDSQINPRDVTYKTTKEYDCETSWQNEAREYSVALEVENGSVAGESSKVVTAYGNVSFNVTLNDTIKESIVTCSDNQTATINGGVVVVSNVTSNTTCTVSTLNVATCPSNISNNSAEYDGADHSINVSNDASGGTVEYSTDKVVWTSTKPLVKDVGQKSIYVRVNGDADHSTKLCTATPATVTVTKRNIVIKANDHSDMHYGDPEPIFNYTVLNGVSGDSAVTGNPQYTVSGSSGTVSNLSTADAGTYTISVSGLEATSNYTIYQYSTGTLTIKKKVCAAPTNLDVSTGGILTWGGTDSNCTKYKVSTDGHNWTENVTSGHNMLSSLTSSAGTKTIYLKSYHPTSDNYSESSAGTKSISVVAVNFTSNNTAAGTINKSTVNVISGAMLSSSGDNLLIKGVTTGSNEITIATITPTANTGYSFANWSKTSGTLGSSTSITATFNPINYQITYDLGGGSAENPSSYNINTDTFTLNEPTREGYKFLGWTGSNGTTPNKTVSIEKGSTGNKNYTANWEIDVVYTVKYNANGGTDAMLTHNDKVYPWIESSGVWKSGNYRVNDSVSTITTKEFTLTSQDTLSFDWAVSSEDSVNDFLYYTIYKNGSVLDDTGMSTAIGGNSSITDEANLQYSTITHVLSPGTYKVSFSYYKDSTRARGLDRGYVKNVKLLNTNLTEMPDSVYALEETKALTKNIFTKNHYNFIGWSTDQNATTPTYTDQQEVKNLSTTNHDIVNLYAIWEPMNYTVNVVVNEGIVDAASKSVVYNNNVTFTVTPNEIGRGYVSCTNDQVASVSGTTLTVSNVNDNTVCTVGFSTVVTTLFEDGALIINEQLGDRDSNVATHGEAVVEYESLSERNVYYFAGDSSQLWGNERSDITKVLFGGSVEPVSTSYWFSNLSNLAEANFTNLNTSDTTDMKFMFNNAGYSVNSFALTGLAALNVSNVTNMDHMFAGTAYNASNINIGDISGWNTGSVEDMNNMFNQFATNLSSFSIVDLSGWNVSRVQDMSQMFYQTGLRATSNWTVGSLSNWITESAVDMHDMFYQAGQNASSWSIGDITGWDVSRVSNMNQMFYSAGQNANSWNIGTLASWNTSNVNYMGSMFAYSGFNSSLYNLNISSWNVSNVSDMVAMFRQAGFKASSWDIGDLSGWNTSNVTDVSAMFESAGHDATTWTSIGTFKVYASDIHIMFTDCPYAKATLNIYTNPSRYEDAFKNAATISGSSITVNYANAVSDIDNIINTKSATSNIIKGSVLS